MLNSVILALLSVFSFIGVILTLELIIKAIRNRHTENPYILIAVRNRADEIEGVIRTLMRKYPNSEFIVIDLGSTDDTHEILKKLSNDYSRIKVKREL